MEPIRPFKDSITGYSDEPSLRIGRTVPKDAVNLAYYFNPTADGDEKVLTADPPRTTIDHRVEDAYRYLFNQTEPDDALFPASVWYEDEDGYAGRLSRKWVNWYTEGHVQTKNIQQTTTCIVASKEDVPKAIQYSADGYEGTLYFDSADYEVTKTDYVNITTTVFKEVLDHELSYHKLSGGLYINSNNIDTWTREPSPSGSSTWPTYIEVLPGTLSCSDGSSAVRNYVNSMESPYNGYTGFLRFQKVEYEPIAGDDPVNGTMEEEREYCTLQLHKSSWDSVLSSVPEGETFESGIDESQFTHESSLTEEQIQQIIDETHEQAGALIEQTEHSVATALDGVLQEAREMCKAVYSANYDRVTDTYDYSEINEFLAMASNYATNSTIRNGTSEKYVHIMDIMAKQGDIVIYRTKTSVFKNGSKLNVEMSYNFNCSTRAQEGSTQYNAIAVYTGELSKEVVDEVKEVPIEYAATCYYSGITRSVTHDYDGQAYYRGSVTKGNSMGNVNPDVEDEILAYSDNDGYLRVPKETTLENGNVIKSNFYKFEGDYFYLTDAFKDGVACFYKYNLKNDIYDYFGPDQQGWYDGSAVTMRTALGKTIPNNYKYTIKLSKKTHNNDNNQDERYSASLYTSFISGSSDTFNVIYNGYNGNNATDGIIEEVYSHPFMHPGMEYSLVPINAAIRENKIKLSEPLYFEDTRNKISFNVSLHVMRKAKTDVSEYQYDMAPFTCTIINREYALDSELNMFDGRAQIISLKTDGVYLSPADMVFRDMALNRITPPIKRTDDDLIYYATIEMTDTSIDGAVNIRCNPDGSGILTAETTLDTGFFNEQTGTFDAKLSIGNPYYAENNRIYPGVMVKAVDSRCIKIKQPREDKLLDSWYPLVQFGHYTQVFGQYSVNTKAAYSMPEYDTQEFSPLRGKPFVDIKKEKVEILNPKMVKTKYYPLLNLDPISDDDTYYYERDNVYFKVFKETISWKDAQAKCEMLGGTLAMPKDEDISNFIIGIAKKYSLNGLWLGATDEEEEGNWKWIDGTVMTYNNWNSGEPNNVGGAEHYLETYCQSNNGKWNDLPNESSSISGYIAQIPATPGIRLFKKVDNDLFTLKIRDVSFADGVIITEDSISENDHIVADYTYIEENYVYRGYWRSPSDFCRLDLNPNIYHTFSDLNYVPSKTSMTKNLFNSVIYFFMKPSVIYESDSPASDNNLVLIDGKYYEKIPVTKVKQEEYEQPIYATREVIVGQKAIYRDELQPVYEEKKISGARAFEDATTLNSAGNVMDNNTIRIPGKASTTMNAESRPEIIQRDYYKGTKYTFRLEIYSNVKRYDAVVITPYAIEYPGSNNTTNSAKKSAIRDISVIISTGYKTTQFNMNKVSSLPQQDIQCAFFKNTKNVRSNHKNDNWQGLCGYQPIYGTNLYGPEGVMLSSPVTIAPYDGKAWNEMAIVVYGERDGDMIRVWVNYSPTGVHNAWLNGKPETPPTLEISISSVGYPSDSISGWGFMTIPCITDSNTLASHTEANSDAMLFGGFDKGYTIYVYKGEEIVSVVDHYEDVYGEEEYVDHYETRLRNVEYTDYEYHEKEDTYKAVYESDYCLYHQIDNFIPENWKDIYIGSVYIRQNTSLHSTVVIDGRTRGGGVLTSIPDGLRHDLEADSDYYLDIGYYDGEPYQENGVIIVRLDRRILKDFGGRFTPSDVEQRVTRWLGFGVFPIIEYVDSYGSKDLPQHSLVIEDTYTNMTDEVPDIMLECIEE